ncbi:MAG: hypothetical protein GDA43_25110 [Hormoscilla sp. SP5CHS1]|nr:hypothetical protein [Hormoscilla sp. SP12CHS1]MBC6456054.1 hypothetical protein [Hormoscilla sp. SP5CHS1]
MSVMILILHQTGTILGNAYNHKFTYYTAEVSWHNHRLQTFYFFSMQLLIDKTEKVNKVVHR